MTDLVTEEKVREADRAAHAASLAEARTEADKLQVGRQRNPELFTTVSMYRYSKGDVAASPNSVESFKPCISCLSGWRAPRRL